METLEQGRDLPVNGSQNKPPNSMWRISGQHGLYLTPNHTWLELSRKWMPCFVFAAPVAKREEVFEPWPDNLNDKSFNSLSPLTRSTQEKSLLRNGLRSKTDQ